MLRLIVRRIAYLIATLLAVSVALFLLFELSPENVAAETLGPYALPEQRQLWLAQHGYFQPAYLRYLQWLGHVLSRDLGQSRVFNAPVADVLLQRLGNSAILAAAFFLVMVPTAIGMGVLAGMREGSALDRVISIIAIVTTSIPPFASVVLLTTIFVFTLHWLPGTSSMLDGFSWRELVLPVLVLVLYDVGYVARITRAAMVEAMASPYVRTAILKGLTRRRVILRHALRNALIAPVTVILLQVNWLIGGVVVVEFFFAYKGFGSLILEAALAQDLYLIEATTMVAVLIAVATQSLADLAYAVLNPRIRYQR
ncbi:MAG: ABC transporter permease [Hyphomicrobiales bacterium]